MMTIIVWGSVFELVDHCRKQLRQLVAAHAPIEQTIEQPDHVCFNWPAPTPEARSTLFRALAERSQASPTGQRLWSTNWTAEFERP
jgi:hypothetical protein